MADDGLYGNAGAKPWHLVTLGGMQRIRIASFERAAPIC